MRGCEHRALPWPSSSPAGRSLAPGCPLFVETSALQQGAGAASSSTSATSPLSGWHAFEWSIDTEAGTIEVAIDDRPMFFNDTGDFAMKLTLECSDPVVPTSAHVRFGPYGEDVPFAAGYDNLVIAPW